MSIFLAPLAAGLVGLALLALPVGRRQGRHGHAGAKGPSRLVPGPRSVLSFMAFEGALGLALAPSLGEPVAALAALLPAVALEVLVARRLSRLLLGFEGRPSTPLEALTAEKAVAVTRFTNGRGIVEAVRDGRSIQLVARLVEEQSALPVRVGERVLIVGVDAERQGVTVTVPV